jgi:hypothetical protein
MKINFQSHFSRFVKLFTLTLIFSVSFSANAEMDFSGTYTGLLFSNSKDKIKISSGHTTEYNRGHVRGKLGWIINDVISVEGQLGFTSNSDSKQGIITTGGYLRAGKDFGQYKLYGLLGLTNIYYYSDNGNTSESGGSYGVGMEIFGSKDLAITLEYLSMVEKSINGGDFTFDALGLGFTYYFIEDKSYFNKNRNKIQSIRY